MRHNALVNALGPINPGTGGGGNGQRQTVLVTADQDIISTSEVIIGANSNPMTWDVNAGAYLFEAVITWSGDQAGGLPDFRFGSTASMAHMCVTFWDPASDIGGPSGDVIQTQVTTLGSDVSGNTLVSGGLHFAWFRGPVVFNTAGTFSLYARDSTSGYTWTIKSYRAEATLESVGQTS